MGKKSPNPVDAHVGARVRMRRMMLRISQEKLADGLELTFQQIQKYEKGVNRIGASRLQQIANIMQVPVAFFFEGAPDAQISGPVLAGSDDGPDIVGQFFTQPYALELAKNYIAIGHNAQRRVVADVAREIAGGAA